MNVSQPEIAVLSEADQALEKLQAKPSRFKPYPKYRASGVDWLESIPEHWTIRKLKYLVALSTQRNATDGMKVGLENIESFTGRYLDTDAVFEGDGVSFQAGDILYGKLRPYLAKVLLAGSEGSAVGDFFVLRLGPDIVPEYLQYRLLEPTFTKLSDGSTFGAKMPRVDWKFMGNLKFSLPSEDEQRAIAGFLRRETAKIDSLVAKKRRLIELLKEKRAALISHAVTKGLNPDATMKPSRIDWLGDVPEHWEVLPLKRYSKRVQTGCTPPTANAEYYSEGTIAWYGPGSFTEELPVSKPSKLINSIAINDGVARLFAAGSVLIVGIGATVGKVAWLEHEGTTNQQITSITPDQRRVNGKYLAYQMKAQENVLRGIAPCTTLPILDQRTIASLTGMFPPFEEQNRIVNHLDKQIEKIDNPVLSIQAAIANLLEYRSALISAAVTGKIDVREEVEG